MPNIHDVTEIETRFRELRIAPQCLRDLRNAFYKAGHSSSESLATLPPAMRAELESEVEFHTLSLEERIDSRLDGATKLLFRTSSGYLIETVLLRIRSGRTTVCVSSQVGCAARCRFCATGTMGIARDLTAAEILDQVIQAKTLVHREGGILRNVVFMGMGEPLHNENNVRRAAEILISPRCFDFSGRRVTLSTVGIPDAMVRFSHSYPTVNLALSLHSARESIRRSIIPLAGRHDLGRLRTALEKITRSAERPVMIEYLLLGGLTDGEEDLRALTAFLEGLSVRVNLIPYNPIEDAPELKRSEASRGSAFADELRHAGYEVTLRYSLGSDIAAACGQLVRRENRRVHASHS